MNDWLKGTAFFGTRKEIVSEITQIFLTKYAHKALT